MEESFTVSRRWKGRRCKAWTSVAESSLL